MNGFGPSFDLVLNILIKLDYVGPAFAEKGAVRYKVKSELLLDIFHFLCIGRYF